VRNRVSSGPIADKNNLVRILVSALQRRCGERFRLTCRRWRGPHPGWKACPPPRAVSAEERTAVEATYTTLSAPNPVTVSISRSRRRLYSPTRPPAIVDLGTPVWAQRRASVA